MKKTLLALLLMLSCVLPSAAQTETVTPKQPNHVKVEQFDCSNYTKRDFPLFWKKHIDIKACTADPNTLVHTFENHNSRTNAGRDWQAGIMGNAQAAPCNYIGVTATSISPAADGSNSDTTLSGEYTTSGFSRAAGTYSHTTGTNAYSLTHDFTPSGTSLAVNGIGLFTAASGGTMCFEASVTTATFNTGDPVLRVTWTVNY